MQPSCESKSGIRLLTLARQQEGRKVVGINAYGYRWFFMGHYLSTGAFAPYIFVGFIAAALFALSALFFVLGIVADMLDRIRSNQERILYIMKKSGMTR